MLDFAGEELRDRRPCGVSKTKFCNCTVCGVGASEGTLEVARGVGGRGVFAGASRADFLLTTPSVGGAVPLEMASGSGDEM
jgi:hypothetical protein